MPVYSYKCEECGKDEDKFCSIAEMEEFERHLPHCCGKPISRVYRTQNPVRFHEGVYEHLGPDPVYISSPQQLADEARKHGNRSKYLRDMGGLWNVKQDRRWI